MKRTLILAVLILCMSTFGLLPELASAAEIPAADTPAAAAVSESGEEAEAPAAEPEEAQTGNEGEADAAQVAEDAQGEETVPAGGETVSEGAGVQESAVEEPVAQEPAVTETPQAEGAEAIPAAESGEVTESQTTETPKATVKTTKKTKTIKKVTGPTRGPKWVTARSVNYQTIRVRWGSVPKAYGYKVYISTKARKGFVLKGKTRSARTLKISGLPTGKRQYFRVEACDKASWKSNTQTGGNAKTTASAKANTTSKVVSAKPSLAGTSRIWRSGIVTNSKAYVSWNEVKGADGYYVYRLDAQRGTYKRVRRTTETSVYQKNLTTDKNYFKIVPYRTVDGRRVAGKARYKGFTMPETITPDMEGFEQSYGAQIISTGRTRLGCPYRFGCSGPTVFDCSGFTYWTMKNSGVPGVSFARTGSRGIYAMYASYRLGRDLSKAQPGDILIFGRGGSASSIFHVGIYYGNGNYIHADGTRVAIAPVPTGKLVTIIRPPGLR